MGSVNSGDLAFFWIKIEPLSFPPGFLVIESGTGVSPLT
jgi:hypothetical protein